MRSLSSLKFGYLTAALVMLGGLVTLSGWYFEIVRLTDWFGLGISMMPNAAIAFILAGFALLLAARGRLEAVVPAILSGVIGLTTFLEHLFHVDLGIDRLLLNVEWGQFATTSPGRMGMPASIMFMLIACALTQAVNTARSLRGAAAVAASISIFISLLAIIGYLYGATSFYVIPEWTAISIGTALLFIVLAIGIISTLPDVQPLRILRSRTAAGAMVRRALPLLIIGPIVIGWLRLEGQTGQLYDPMFGTALRSVIEVVVLLAVLWWMARAVEEHEHSRRQSDEALRSSEERYRTFIQNSSEGIWRIELERPIDITLPVEEQIDLAYRYGILAECNDAMARMYGLERAEDLVGARLGDMMPRTQENIAYLTAFVRSGYNLHGGESEERDKDGTPVFFSNNLVGIIENGRLMRGWGTQSDITEQRLTEMALREADRRKDEFLATLSHELRNPLSPIVSGVELIVHGRDGLSAEELQRVEVVVQRQLEHMVRLIDDLMDVSRINRGKIELRLEEVELAPLLNNAIEACRPLIDQHRHTLHVSMPKERIRLRGDPVRLAQVFQNVINNAAKYTDDGGTIQVEARKQDDEVIIRITDTGIGLEQKDIPKIFEMFGQVDRSITRSSSGLGIGLALVRRLVEKHKGEVSASSDGPGKGTTFTIRLPLIVQAQPVA